MKYRAKIRETGLQNGVETFEYVRRNVLACVDKDFLLQGVGREDAVDLKGLGVECLDLAGRLETERVNRPVLLSQPCACCDD